MIFASFLNWMFSVFLLSVMLGNIIAGKQSKLAVYSFGFFIFLGANWAYFLIKYFDFWFDPFALSLFSAILFLYTLRVSGIGFFRELARDFGIVSLILFPLYLSFGDVFVAWDALASWNRWAKEIFNGEYIFSGTAYPVLVSSIVALVYEFQSTDAVNFTAKFSLITIPVFLLLIAKADQNNPKMFIALCIIFFNFLTNKGVLSGEADFPVSIAGLVVLYLCFISNIKSDIKYSAIAFLIAGPVCLLKQSGIPFFCFSFINFLYLLFTIDIGYIKRERSLLIWSLILSSSFPISFYFLHLIFTESLTSNLSYLVGLSAQASVLDIFNRYFDNPRPQLDFIMIPVSLFAFYVLLRKASDDVRFFVLVSGVFFVLGSFFWIYAFSYDSRNAVWAKSFALFTLVIYFSEARFVERVRRFCVRHQRLWDITGLSLSTGGLCLLGYLCLWGQTTAENFQRLGELEIGPVDAALELSYLLGSDESERCPYLVTNDLLIRHNFYLKSYAAKILDVPASVESLLSDEVPKCVNGGFFYFGSWSKNDPTWHLLMEKADTGEIWPVDPDLGVYRRP